MPMEPKPLSELRIKLFADGAERASMLAFAKDSRITGFTTNPTLMRAAGVTDYAGFAQEILGQIRDKPISFEVFSDDFVEMERQARIIHAWGENVYVKIPITDTRGESSAPLIRKLSEEHIRLNITAILTAEQVRTATDALAMETPAIVSVFAGRIADTGRDALPIMRECKTILQTKPATELLWASCREVFNMYEAESVGADIITVPYSILHSLGEIGSDLTEYSLEGVKAFYEAGAAAGYTL